MSIDWDELDKMTEKREHLEHVRPLKKEEESNSFRDVEQYVKDRDSGEVRLKDEAVQVERVDTLAIPNQVTNLAALIGSLVAKYKVSCDKFSQRCEEYVDGNEYASLAMVMSLANDRRDIVWRLLKELEEARSRNLLENGCERQLDASKKEIEQLKEELANCKTELEELKNERELLGQVNTTFTSNVEGVDKTDRK
jgi:vacuolar-type H+-ATPase subunit I/STV1